MMYSSYIELFLREPEPMSLVAGGGLKAALDGVAWTSEIHSCCNPSLGFILFSGSQIRHLEIKSRNTASLHFRDCPSVLVRGFLFLPLELTTIFGFPAESTGIEKKNKND